MDSPNITRVECNLHMDVINEKLDTGFNGINSRLDKLNGKIERHESLIGKLQNALLTGPRRPLTVWDILLVIGTLGISFELLTRVLGYHR